MTDALQPIERGTRLAHYRIEEKLGEGAMGTVYRAHDTSLDRDVALKVLKANVSEDDLFVRRFVREARAAARVSHPNLAHIYFIGEEKDTHYFAMEYVEGRDLDEVVQEDGPLELVAALDVLEQAARGLAAAHRRGVVHRDVKPSNILLQKDGGVRITDFGLAKSIDLDLDATQPGQILGTPRFMSPEQCKGEGVDARTDIYALGLTAWFLLAGRDPFDTPSLGALINDQINTPLPSLSELRPDLPPELDQVLCALCEKDPAKRLDDMDTVVERLEACRPHPVPPAPLATRGIAAGIDAVVALATVELLLQALDRGLGFEGLLDHRVVLLLGPVFFAAYHIFSEAWWGQTPAKWLFGIEARAASGMRLKTASLAPRFLLRYPWVLVAPLEQFDLWVPFRFAGEGLQALAILAGVIAYFATKGHSLSDLVTRTCVTYRVKDLPPEKTLTPSTAVRGAASPSS